MSGVVDVGALLQDETRVVEQLPDVQEDRLQLLRGTVHKVAKPGDKVWNARLAD